MRKLCIVLIVSAALLLGIFGLTQPSAALPMTVASKALVINTVHDNVKQKGAINQPATTESLKAIAARIRGKESKRIAAFEWARHRRGCWYSWGGTTCSPGFDCSGLVYAAYGHVGMHFGRTTYDMLASGKLRKIKARYAKRGDLAFFGSGHVELVAYKWKWTLGARDVGTQVREYHNFKPWFYPSAFYRVKDSNDPIRA